jgi:hypothetical protein
VSGGSGSFYFDNLLFILFCSIGTFEADYQNLDFLALSWARKNNHISPLLYLISEIVRKEGRGLRLLVAIPRPGRSTSVFTV